MRIEVKWNPAWVRPPRAPGDRRWWILGCAAIRREVRVETVLRIEVFPKRLAALVGTCALLGYLAAATALWLWLRRTPQNQVGWTLAATAPFRWETFRERRGDTDIAVAQERLRQREWGDAYFALRTGVARSPGNVPGRIALAGLLQYSSPEQARRTLEDGLERSAGDPDLLRALFALLRQQQAASRALALSAELLDRQPARPPAARQLAANARAAVLLEQGRWPEAAAVLAGLAPTGDAAEDRRTRILRADLHRLEGRFAEARAALAEGGPAPHADLLRAEAEVAVAARDEAALEGVLRRWRAAADEQPAPYLFAFEAWHRLGRPSLRDRAEQEYFDALGHRETALQLFAAAAVGLELPDAVRRAEEAARAAGFSRFAFRVHLTELALRAGDLDAAFRLLRDWEGKIETLPPAQRAYPEFIHRLARAAIGGPTQPVAPLAGQVAAMRGQAPPGVSLLAARVLERAGHPVGAREMLDLGLRVYPESDPLRREAERLAAVATPPAEPAVASVRPAPVAVAERLGRVDAALAGGRLVEARDLLRELRTAVASDAPGDEAELAWRELQLALLTRDALGVRASLRAHLGRHRGGDEARRLLQLADALEAGGHPEVAQAVRTEVGAASGARPEVTQALRDSGIAPAAAEVPATAAEASAALDAALRREDPDHALWLLGEYRRQGPAWLAGAQDELTLREVRARLQQDRRPAALIAFRGLVMRPGAPRAAAFRLVRELAAAGGDASARALAQEVVRLLPGDPAAAALLRQVEAPRPPTD